MGRYWEFAFGERTDIGISKDARMIEGECHFCKSIIACMGIVNGERAGLSFGITSGFFQSFAFFFLSLLKEFTERRGNCGAEARFCFGGIREQREKMGMFSEFFLSLLLFLGGPS